MDGSHSRSWLADSLVLTLYGHWQTLPLTRSVSERLFPPSVRFGLGDICLGFCERGPLCFHAPGRISPGVYAYQAGAV